MRGVLRCTDANAGIECAPSQLTVLCPAVIGRGLSPRVPSAEDKKQALRLNEDWDRHRQGLPAVAVQEHKYPEGSVGHGYLRVMALRETERRQENVI